ncbi:MAG: YajQ family cyclic di-GMP-binding protein [SAR86 cluster bacterium]|uniref:Nucleotide-binding protein COC19_08090 n=1 Tax=SAR86 cluster bacterium TaxID=2030880 RepID=A0A2A4MFB2_9GAMM|nr:MAG: YajQ family cyclic di-GMP-binding protein [SAR86 cluster bacterium]
MPSFDIVSEVDMHEMNNALDQANREVGTRFDFKGVDAKFELVDEAIQVRADSDFQIRQMLDILRGKLVKREIDIKSLEEGDIVITGQQALMSIKVVQGIESELARKLVKKIKAAKLKVQTAIQGEKLRVTGKKRDDLQAVMALIRESNSENPLQFNNFRD